MTKKPLIQFENFSFQYFAQAKPTLKNISLTIYEGEKVLIAGPSGSGKSTLGNCINGLIPFSLKGQMTGSLAIAGRQTKDLSIFELSKTVGTVLQDPDGQFIGITAGEDIAFALENECTEQSKMKAEVQKAADIVNMGSLLSSSPQELSGGQKQRIAFAGVMVHDVDILLFDEPLASLDPKTGKTAIELIDSIKRDYDKTVIIIEHRLEDVLYREVDRIIVINDGSIIADAPADQIMSSAILPSIGIREPLYVSALRAAGVDVRPALHPGRLETLDIEAVKPALQAWTSRQAKPQPATERPSILKVEDLQFSYTKKRKIIKGISFDIQEGQMVAMVGTNGAGKSTLAKLLCGFVKEDSGRILYKGQDIADKTIKERSSFIGYVMQNPNQMICKPMIYDEVALGLRFRKMDEALIKEKVSKTLEICGLRPFMSWPISALSFGQKKRVTIASMLVMDPQILILDEPTAGQDHRRYTDIMEFLRSLNQQG
ncbi:MAG: ABC transporter ATP-binding protein, partial [Sphaerochaetaceae bacterium]|nr:ABC transporter ATP-binding protein [Sphaerochaetaceae bacterium]